MVDEKVKELFWDNVFEIAKRNHRMTELKDCMGNSFWIAKKYTYNPTLKMIVKIAEAIGARGTEDLFVDTKTIDLDDAYLLVCEDLETSKEQLFYLTQVKDKLKSVVENYPKNNQKCKGDMGGNKNEQK